MIGRSSPKAAAARTPRGAATARVILKVSACSISLGGLALFAGWGLTSGFLGCSPPTIQFQPPDLAGQHHPGGDGGSPTGTVFSAAPVNSGQGVLVSEGASAPTYQRWKRDPGYALDGSDQYMFYAGSNYPATAEQWSLAYFKATSSTMPPAWPAASVLIFSGRTGMWDGQDLTAPTAIVKTGAQNKFMLWYAANGDPTKPGYVTQIGLATSNDGTNWTRSNSPALAVPTFTNTGASGTPTTARPDAYGVTDPWIMPDGVTLYYAGLDCSVLPCVYRIFRTVSTDGGHTFPPGSMVLSGRPGVAQEVGGVAGPSVVQFNGNYLLAYTAVGTAATQDRLGVRTALTTGSVGLAVSTDGGQTFTNDAQNMTALIQHASGTNYSEGASAPSLYTVGSNVQLYFGGLIDEQGVGTYFNILPAPLTAIND